MSNTAPDSVILLACRICLSCDSKLYNICEWGLDQVFANITGSTISIWDGLPQHICGLCRTLLLKSHELRSRCLRAQELLKRSLMQHQIITTSYIRTINRKAHRLVHNLSNDCSKADIKVYIHQDKQTDTNEIKAHKNDEFKHVIVKTEAQNDSLAVVEKIEYDPDDTSLDKEEMDFEAEIDDTLKDVLDVKVLELGKCEETIDIPVKIENDSNKNVKEIDTLNMIDLTVDNGQETGLAPGHDVKDTTKDEIVIIVQSLKRKNDTKKKKVTKNDTNKEKVPQNDTKKKKVRAKPKDQWKVNPNWHTFCTTEHYRAFEKKYNFKITVLTEEEMLQDMEKRKQTDNYKNAMNKCELCFKGHLSMATFNNHMRAHDPKRGSFECKLCHKYFAKRSDYNRHFLMDHQLKFECVSCGEIVRSKARAEAHAAFHAGATFQCEHCDLKFLKQTSFTTHKRIAHPDKHADRATCEECGETFISEGGLKNHRARSHRTQHAVWQLRCRACKIQFESFEALERHRNGQPNSRCDPKLSACAACGATCADGDALLEHRKSEHGVEIFTCDMCSKPFTSKLSLSTHIDRVHLKIKPKMPVRPGYKFKSRPSSGTGAAKAKGTGNGEKETGSSGNVLVCELCGKVMQCMALLRQHLLVHAGEKPYKCRLCPKAYVTHTGLTLHKVSHTGERKYECPECQARFMHQTSVEVHRRIHRGEKPFQCKICDKTFVQSGSLHNHVKYVHMKATPPPRKRHKKSQV